MSKKNKHLQDDDTSSADFHGVNKIKLSDVIIMFIISLLCLTCILPFLHVAAKSLSSNSAVMTKSVYIFPKGLNFDAYITIFRDGQLIRAMVYTILITVIYTVLGVVVTIFAAYPLSRKKLKGREAILIILLFSMYFGAGLIPEYLLYKDLNLLDTMWVLILPGVFSPYNIIIMKTFFQANIPDSLEESAFLDGATNFQILWKIVLPLSKAIIATVALFNAVARWNAYGDARYFITTKALQPIQYLLYNMVLSSSSQEVKLYDPSTITSTPEVLLAAIVMFATIPIICVYPFVQKYFVKGAMIGAVKG